MLHVSNAYGSTFSRRNIFSDELDKTKYPLALLRENKGKLTSLVSILVYETC